MRLRQTRFDVWALAPLALWLLASLEGYVWLGALLMELQLWLAVVLLLAALFLMWRARPQSGVACAVSASLFLLPLWPFVRPVHPTPAHGSTLQVAHIDLAQSALSEARLAAWLARSSVDVLSLARFEKGTTLSRGGVVEGRVVATPSQDALLLVKSAMFMNARNDHVSVRVGRCAVDVVSLVLPSLLQPARAAERKQQLQQLGNATLRPRSLFVGSLGSRSAAADLHRLLEHHELRDARLGQGYLGTWPGGAGPLGLPHSHVLVHGWIAVKKASAEEPIVPGAARTLLTTVELTEPRCREP